MPALRPEVFHSSKDRTTRSSQNGTTRSAKIKTMLATQNGSILKARVAERGQALAETAMFAVLAAIVGFGILALIPFHRTRTAATSAAYGCAQFLGQSPLNQHLATSAAKKVATDTLNTFWSGTFGVNHKVSVQPPGGPGQPGSCTVSWFTPVLFNGLLGLHQGGWDSITFVSRAEDWKAAWK